MIQIGDYNMVNNLDYKEIINGYDFIRRQAAKIVSIYDIAFHKRNVEDIRDVSIISYNRITVEYGVWGFGGNYLWYTMSFPIDWLDYDDDKLAEVIKIQKDKEREEYLKQKAEQDEKKRLEKLEIEYIEYERLKTKFEKGGKLKLSDIKAQLMNPTNPKERLT